MIYRKRAYTPPPLRRVDGTEYSIEMRAPDGSVLRTSYLVRNAEVDLSRYPRQRIADELRRMRRALRERMEQYLLGVEIF